MTIIGNCPKCGEEKKLSKCEKICYSCCRVKRKARTTHEKFVVNTMVGGKVSREKNALTIKLNNYRTVDKQKGLEGNDLDLEFLESSLAKDCFYCGPTDIVMTLDRKDNDKAHTKENCNPCCYRCNLFRGSMPYEAWMYIVPSYRQAKELGLLGSWKSKHYSVLKKEKAEAEGTAIDLDKQDECPCCHVMKPWYKNFCGMSCAAQSREPVKVDWTKIDLIKELETKTITQLADELDVDYNTVRYKANPPIRKSLPKECKHCPNTHVKYSKYCSSECAELDGEKFKEVVDWNTVNIEGELKTLSVDQLANKIGCTKRALQTKIFSAKRKKKQDEKRKASHL